MIQRCQQSHYGFTTTGVQHQGRAFSEVCAGNGEGVTPDTHSSPTGWWTIFLTITVQICKNSHIKTEHIHWRHSTFKKHHWWKTTTVDGLSDPDYKNYEKPESLWRLGKLVALNPVWLGLHFTETLEKNLMSVFFIGWNSLRISQSWPPKWNTCWLGLCRSFKSYGDVPGC